jgi:hypothetical protein
MQQYHLREDKYVRTYENSTLIYTNNLDNTNERENIDKLEDYGI